MNGCHAIATLSSQLELHAGSSNVFLAQATHISIMLVEFQGCFCLGSFSLFYFFLFFPSLFFPSSLLSLCPHQTPPPGPASFLGEDSGSVISACVAVSSEQGAVENENSFLVKIVTEQEVQYSNTFFLYMYWFSFSAVQKLKGHLKPSENRSHQNFSDCFYGSWSRSLAVRHLQWHRPDGQR